MIYIYEENLTIRSMMKDDIYKFVEAFAAQNWDKPSKFFEEYYEAKQFSKSDSSSNNG